MVIWRATKLTFRIHRFEVAMAVVLMALVGAGLVVVPGRLASVGVPADCFRQEGAPACRSLLDAFNAIRSNEASWLLGVGAGLFPVLIGLLLGGPVVGSELETRTTTLAWALTGDRRRWLIHRLLPMGIVLVAGLALLGVLETSLLRMTDPLGRPPRIDEIGSQGPTFVTRGVMAMGVALLVGSILGRSLATFIVGGLIAVSLVIAGAPFLYLTVAQQNAVWRDVNVADDLSPMVIEFEQRYIDQSSRVHEWSDVQAIVGDDPESDQLERLGLRLQARGLPYESFGLLESSEALVALAIGGASGAMTFVVVRRRRPE